MKKNFSVFVLLFSMLFTCGCVKKTYNVEIDRKGNITTQEIQALNIAAVKSEKPYAAPILKQKFYDNKEALQKGQAVVELYENGDFSGVKYTQKFKINEFKNEDLPKGFTSLNSVPVLVDKGFIRDIYTINLTFNPKTAISAMQKQNKSIIQGTSLDDDTQQVETSETESEPNFNFDEKFPPVLELSIKIPYRATSHNAQNVTNKKEYQWKFSYSAPCVIQLEYQRYSFIKILFLIASFVALIFLLIKFQEYKSSSDW